MASPGLIASLHDAVSEAVAAHDNKHYKLKDAVCAIVDELKKSGEPPERILTRVRSLIAAAPGAKDFTGIGDHTLAWCLDRYFGSH